MNTYPSKETQRSTPEKFRRLTLAGRALAVLGISIGVTGCGGPADKQPGYPSTPEPSTLEVSASASTSPDAKPAAALYSIASTPEHAPPSARPVEVNLEEADQVPNVSAVPVSAVDLPGRERTGPAASTVELPSARAAESESGRTGRERDESADRSAVPIPGLSNQEPTPTRLFDVQLEQSPTPDATSEPSEVGIVPIQMRGADSESVRISPTIAPIDRPVDHATYYVVPPTEATTVPSAQPSDQDVSPTIAPMRD